MRLHDEIPLCPPHCNPLVAAETNGAAKPATQPVAPADDEAALRAALARKKYADIILRAKRKGIEVQSCCLNQVLGKREDMTLRI